MESPTPGNGDGCNIPTAAGTMQWMCRDLVTCWAGARATAFQGAPSRRTASLGAAVGLTSGPTLSRASVPGPVVGFGTSGIKEVSLLAFALRLGYRLVDTAAFYGNEEEVGSALRETRMTDGLPLETSVTTKVWWTDMSFDKAKSSVQRSLQKLGTRVADLVLIHWPGRQHPPKENGNRDARKATWEALCELKQAGSIREIGVSNFTVRHLKELEGYSMQMPAVNQVELHPYLQQKELFEYCQQKGIQVQAYSPLASGRLRLLSDPVLREVAATNGISPAQVKTTSAVRMRENLRAEILPDLPQSDADAITGLDRQESCDVSGGLVSPDRIA
ncbi:hypothetical protein AK812_SmicGene17188 [Symbiodinium microadriaticum]|uniref:NADP-dependent oxidoreductase domain-containing protein n=1 Tax=Symbiodinium microadriaticum TaxID=2951 RepID=A0A1Q9DYF9_SYMMI|nr:hypothetical protein AK812_SmicGene17188 [Symbiodinium microadriaticum]